jgi:hypothetical protein
MFKTGRYEIVGELGRGSMGVVYEALDPLINRRVAIKTMRTEGLSQGEYQDYKARFQREAHAAGALAHPNIVTIHDFGEDHSVLYLAMEFLDGISLRELLDEKRVLPIESIISIFQQVSSALDYAHSRHIIHRDIKPANIMILESGVVKVTDFGIAKVLSTETGMTQVGQILGTPTYMSPEQVKGQPVDGRSDVFSLGVILYESSTGQKPFGGQNVTTVMYKIINEPPAAPVEVDTGIHPALASVIGKALAKNPDRRYQTCGALAEDLRNYKEFRRGPSASGAVVAGRSGPAIAAVRPAPRPSRFPAAAWIGVGALIVVGVLAGGYHRARLRKLPIPAARGSPPASSQTTTPQNNAGAVASSAPAAQKPAPAGESSAAGGVVPDLAPPVSVSSQAPGMLKPQAEAYPVPALERRPAKNPASASLRGRATVIHSSHSLSAASAANSQVAPPGGAGTKKETQAASPAPAPQQPASPPGSPASAGNSVSADASEFVLETEPTGVDAFIDGKLVGRTDKDKPVITSVTVGEHTLVLKYQGVEVLKRQFKKTPDAQYKKWVLPVSEPVP